MSFIITLYQGCKLTNKYQQVFKDRTTMETYLATLPYKEVYRGDEIYYTNSGTISIESNILVGRMGDKYNYIQFTHATEGGILTKRFAFINNITIVNDVAVIEYSEDIWHTYCIDASNHKIKLFNSLLVQAKNIYGGTGYEYTATEISQLPKALPVELEGQNSPHFLSSLSPNLYERFCYVILTASVYKLSSNKVNERYISNYLLSYEQQATGSYTPSDTNINYQWPISNETLTAVQDLKAKSTDTQVSFKTAPNFYYEIIDVKIIPKTIGDSFFTSVLSSDNTHDDGLHADFNVSVSMVGQATDLTYQYFNTNIAFNNLILGEEYKYNSGGNTRYTYNGYRVNSIITHSKNVLSDKKYIAIGNMSRIIPITFNGQTKSLIYQFIINQFDNIINLFFDNTITDISDDFTLNVPLEPQSADITQQQKIALESGNICSMLSMAGATAGLGASIGSAIGTGGKSMGGDIGSSSMGMVKDALNIVSAGVQLDARNQAQYVKNKAVNVSETATFNCVLGGLREIDMAYTNGTFVDSMIDKYGYLVNLIVNNFDTVYGANNYIRFAKANVYGDFSQSIASQIEDILQSGTTLL